TVPRPPFHYHRGSAATLTSASPHASGSPRKRLPAGDRSTPPEKSPLLSVRLHGVSMNATSSIRKISVDPESLDQYLREISAYPLINREQEADLARRIRRNEFGALERLVRSNLRFVVSVAKRYQNQGVSPA